MRVVKGKRLLLVGLGDVGAQTFDLLLRLPGQHRFLVGGRSLDHVRQRTNLSAFAAMQLGHTPHVSCTTLDLQNVDRTAETIASFHPDIIFCAATLQRWGVVSQLPKALAEQVYQAQIGPWLPIHLSLVHKLMQAVAATQLPIQVVNATYPDAAHPVLGKVGLAPVTGIGDLANNIPALRKSIALKLHAPVEQVEVRLVAQHHVSYWMSRRGHSGGAPFHLTAFVNGIDCTDQLSMSKVFDLLPGTLKRTPGNLMTAASAASVLDGFLNDTHQIVHVPGPHGLPGGYPVRVSQGGVQVILPDTITLDEAVSVNTTSQLFDGIEQIDEDGTVSFAEKNMAIFQRLFGYECRQMALSDVDQWAEELRGKYRAFAKKHGAVV